MNQPLKFEATVHTITFTEGDPEPSARLELWRGPGMSVSQWPIPYPDTSGLKPGDVVTVTISPAEPAP